MRIAIAGLLAALLCLSPAYAKVVISTGGWPPFLTPQQQHYGFIGHLISDVFAESGVEVEYRLVPWRRAYVGAVSGEYDATAVWMANEERKQDFFYSEPILDERFVFFHRSDMPFDWDELSDLSDLKFAGVLGYSYGSEFDEAVEAGILNIEWVTSEESTIQMLLAGRIDAFPQEINVGYFNLKQLLDTEAVGRITHHPRHISVNQSYLLLPRSLPNSEALLETFNDRLALFKESGRYDAYFRAFENGDYSTGPLKGAEVANP